MSDLASVFGGPAPSSEADAPVGGPQETVTTPSGIEISFQTEPKRQYKLRRAGDKWGRFDRPFQEVPSVTEVLSVLDKPGLSWWGMKVGVEGFASLLETNEKNDPLWLEGRWWTRTDRVVKELTERKLTVNHVKTKAGDRGSGVHKALETWAEKKILPDPAIWPEEEQGYVTALRAFLEESQIEPLRSEVMVGSLEHGYAGRTDLYAYYGGQEVNTHLTPKNAKRGTYTPGLFLLDLKTSSGIYETHHLQLAAYAHAAQECDYEKPDDTAVLRCGKDGRYELKLGVATFEDFLPVLETYRAMKRLKEKK